MTATETIPVTYWAKADTRLELLRKLDHELNIIASKAGTAMDVEKEIHSQNAGYHIIDCLAVEKWATQKGAFNKNAKEFYLCHLNSLIPILDFFGMTRFKEKIESLRQYISEREDK